MAQSVELLLDPGSEAALLAEWERLADAGLPTERRSQPSPHHRPHITLYAADAVPAPAEDALPGLMIGLHLRVVVGAPLVFGPRGGRYVLVRQVVPSLPLLQLQRQVAETCTGDPGGHFGPGRWTPHVTLARRMSSTQVAMALDTLGSASSSEVLATVTDCRRWDGTARTAWSLT